MGRLGNQQTHNSVPQVSEIADDRYQQPRVGDSALSRVFAACQRVGIKPAGLTLMLIACVCGLAGWWLSWVELKVAAVFCVVLLITSLVFLMGRPSFEAKLAVLDTRLVVGEDASLDIIFTNSGRHRTWPIRMELPIGEHLAAFMLKSMAAGASHIERFVIPTDKRGVLLVGPARSVQGDPFGFSGRDAIWSETIDVFVHPRTVPLPGYQVGLIHDLEGHSSSRMASSDMSFHALREYVPGDDRRHVHWKTTARTQKLMVRQYEETLQSRVCVGLDLASGSYVGAENFELAVSVASSVALQALREQNPLAILTNDSIVMSVNARRALDGFSGVDVMPDTSLFELVTYVSKEEPGASVVVCVTGSGITRAQVGRACQVFDIDTRVVAIRVDVGASMSVQTVGNLSFVTIGYLAQLPYALRRIVA